MCFQALIYKNLSTSTLNISQIAIYINPLTTKIHRVILPTNYHTFPYKLHKRIWCYAKITPTSLLPCLFTQPVHRTTYLNHNE